MVRIMLPRPPILRTTEFQSRFDEDCLAIRTGGTRWLGRSTERPVAGTGVTGVAGKDVAPAGYAPPITGAIPAMWVTRI